MKSLIVNKMADIIGQNNLLGIVQFFKSNLNENMSILIGFLSFTLVVALITFIERKADKKRRKEKTSFQA